MSEIRTDTINNASGDNDSGIDLSTNDQVSIKTANTTRATVDSSGNMGIGTSSPSLSTASGSATGLEINGSVPALNLNAGSSDEFLIYGGSSNANILVANNNPLRIITGGSETARLDSSNNLLVGQTSFAYGSVGCSMTSSGQLGGTANGDSSLILNRKTSDGTIAQFRKDNTVVGTIGCNSGLHLVIGKDDTGLNFQANEIIAPSNPSTGSVRDNAIDLGASNARFDDIYATNGTIQTSDRNEKQDIEELSDAEQRVAVVAKGLMRKFRWIDSVAEKGDNARIHFGIIAQDLQDAFTAEGLDAGDYAMFTSTTWWEKEISVDAVEADEENGIEAKDAYTYMDTKDEATVGYTEKTRLGVRYNQLLAFIISAI